MKLQDGSTFADGFQSEDMRTLRQNLISGVKDDRCRTCWDLEARGIPSKREVDGGRYEADLLKRGPIKQDLDFQPMSWDIKLGSTCNLRCRMCNEETSTAIMAESIQRGLKSIDEGQRFVRQTKDFLRNPKLFDELNSILPFAKEIYFLGGEPTLMPAHLSLIDGAIAKGLHENLRLRWSTNMTHFDHRFLSRAKKFKNVTIDCSIDAVEELYSYIRGGGDFDEVTQNLSQLREEMPEAELKIVCTVQIYNVFQLPKIIDWFSSRGYLLVFNFLNHPDWLNTQNLWPGLKESIHSNYETISNSLIDEFLRWNQGEGDPSKMRDFEWETRSLDNYRNEKFRDFIPFEHLAEWDSFFDLQKISGPSPYVNL